MDRRQIEKQARKAEALRRAKLAEANRAGAGRKRQFERAEASKPPAPLNERKQVKKKKVKKKQTKNPQISKKERKKQQKRKKQEYARRQAEIDWKKSGMSREEYRQAERIKREKKKLKKKRRIKIFLILIILATGAILSVTVFFNIETVNVKGFSQYNKEEIKDASGIRTGDNLILLKKAETAERIEKKLPYTGEVTIRKVFPSAVEIQVEDTKIEAAVKSGSDYYILNGKGKVLKTVNSEKEVYKTVMEQSEIAKKQREALKKKLPKPKEEKKPEEKKTEEKKPVPEDYKGDVIIIRGFKVKKGKPGYQIEIKDKEKYKEYEKLLKLLKKQGINDITGMDFSKKTDIVLYYDDRIEIHLGTGNKMEQKLGLGSKIIREQNKVSKEQKGLIDLTIPGKGYFSEGKPKISHDEPDENNSEDKQVNENVKKADNAVRKQGSEDSKHNN